MRIEEAEKIITEILDNFDFKKVHAYMVLTDWKWHETHVPTVEELREVAHRNLLYACRADEAETICSSGGLTAYKNPLEVSLIFELENRTVDRREVL